MKGWEVEGIANLKSRDTDQVSTSMKLVRSAEDVGYLQAIGHVLGVGIYKGEITHEY
jgi:hypothetical protein